VSWEGEAAPGVRRPLLDIRRGLEPHEEELIVAVQEWARAEAELRGRLPKWIEIATAGGLVRVIS
jgi:hypothetical protein